MSGQLTTLMTWQSKGLLGVLGQLDEQLPAVSAAGKGDVMPAGMMTLKWADAEEAYRDSAKVAGVTLALRLLSQLLWEPSGREAATVAHNEGVSEVLLRAVLLGTRLLAASHADDQWGVLAGDALDAAAVGEGRLTATEALAAAAAATSGFLQHLRTMKVPLRSASLLWALLKAHGQVAIDPDCLATMLGGGGGEAGRPPSPSPAAAARFHLASCLRCWAEAAPAWHPDLLRTLFFGAKTAGLEAGAVAGLLPRDLFLATCLLGDLCPSEWPPPGRRAEQPPPPQRAYRKALAKSIEPCGVPFRRLIASAITSESRLLRAGVVRVCARAAGLGGGMGPFLVEPIIEELKGVAASPAPLHDARRLLEVLVPLVYRPALKAALLDGELLPVMVDILDDVISRLGEAEGGAEAVNVCTMAMEVVMVLCNPEVGLNPLAPPEQQRQEETPPVKQGALLAVLLLEKLPQMGVNAMIGHRVLKLLAESETGRVALRRAVVRVHSRGSGSATPPEGDPPQIQLAQAAQWVASRYWKLAEGLGSEAGSEGLKGVYTDLVNIMQKICLNVEEDQVRKIPAASARFVAALQATMQAAAAAGVDIAAEEVRWTAPWEGEALGASSVFDPVTRMFWRNVRARACQQSSASAAYAMRRFARHDCMPDADASIVRSLHPPLTSRKRPRDETLDLQPRRGEGPTPQQDKEADGKLRGTPRKGGGAGGDTPKGGAAEGVGGGVGVRVGGPPPPSAVPDLPPVIASPRAGRRGPGGSSRPASKHVDEFQKGTGVKGGGSSGGGGGSAGKAKGKGRGTPNAGGVGSSAKAGPLRKGSGPTPAVDLYADLVPQAGGGPAGGGGTPLGRPPTDGEHVAQQGGTTQQAQQGAPGGVTPRPMERHPAVGLQQAQQAAAQQPPADPEITAILQDRAAIGALLQDPARLQGLLERNPHLMSMLKARLGMS